MVADIGNLSISYDSLGNGKCVVLIHAIGVNRRMWQEVAKLLKADHNVIVYDLRGHGDTSTAGNNWTLEMFSDDLRGLLDHLGLSSCSMVGLSLGGMIAQTFVLRHPSRVDKLVLSNTTSGQQRNHGGRYTTGRTQ
jgi:3-oxoadipate enol-lactonase